MTGNNPDRVWTQYTIKDFIDKGEVELQTGPFGTQLHASDYVKTGTPMINARNIGFGEIRTEKLEYLSDDTVKRLSSHLLHTGDLVFGRKGTVERHVLIRPDQDGWFQGTDCLRIRFKSKSINPRFVSYTFLTEYHKQWMINQSSHGATMTSLNQGIISRIPLNLPVFQVQNKIASVLSAYDDLIENNIRRIKILEEMAQMVYREWFVNFRFAGHEGVQMAESELGLVPKGWEVQNLFDIADVTYGFPFKSNIFTSEPTDKPVIRIRNILNDYTDNFTTESVSEKYIVKNGDLLVGMDGDFHMGKWAGGVAYLNQRVVRFRPKDKLSTYYLYLALEKPIQYFDSTITGTTVAHLSDRDLKSIRLLRIAKNPA